MTDRLHYALVAGLVLAMLGGMGFTTVASGAEDCDALFNDDCEVSTWAATQGFVSGFADHLTETIGLGDDESTEPTASETAQNVREYFNTNNQTFVREYNDRVSSDRTETAYVRVTFEDDSENVESVFLEAEFDSDGNMTNAQMLDELPQGVTVDEYARLGPYAQENALSELKTFEQDYLEDDEPVDSEYLGRMRGAYGDSIERSSFGVGNIE